MSLKERGFEVLEMIGKGSFGQASVVRRKGSTVALVAKEVDLKKLGKRDTESSRNEVEMLRHLSHPNIVRFIEAWEHNKRLHIIMEYADGGDLSQLLTRQRKSGVFFSEEDILGYFIQICLPLKYLHGQRVLHRDLKTMNVFLTKASIVKLGDFGVAKQLGTVGVTRTVCGTPYYFSPEMCRSEPYSNKCDIWSLGIILYELIMLSKPFLAENIRSLMSVIVLGKMQPMKTVSDHSDSLRELCMKLLEVDAAERPSIGGIMSSEFMQKKIRRFIRAIRDRTEDDVALAPKGWAQGSPRSPPAPAARSPPASPPREPPPQVAQQRAPAASASSPASSPPASPGKRQGYGGGKMSWKRDMKAMISQPPPEYEDMKAAPAPAKSAAAPAFTLSDCTTDHVQASADRRDMAVAAERDSDGGGDFGDADGVDVGQLRAQLEGQLGPACLAACFKAYENCEDTNGLEIRLRELLKDRFDELLPGIERCVFPQDF